MQQRTRPQPSAARESEDPRPVDLETMRDTARRLLNLGEAPPLREDLDKLTAKLRGHVQLLVPEIRALLRTKPANDHCSFDRRASRRAPPRPNSWQDRGRDGRVPA
ncbi:DUF6415 family natural product biosynthesis protein [Streptomyces sp. NPDC006283]|uniref:DUF6415 family natural product biosynthesis protein n=1 Tax=Streptomyces sp. NPDC006283 TaxID=3156741 RepID=UPI0033A3FB2A